MRHTQRTAPVLLATLCLTAPAAFAQDRAGNPAGPNDPPSTSGRVPAIQGDANSPPDRQMIQANRAGSDVPVTASAELRDAKGGPVGTVAFIETPQGTLIEARLENVPPGWHGFHIHENGRCDPPDFKSAGGHWNPTDASHGFLARQGGHVGDLPNVFAGPDGKVMVDIQTDRVRLRPGANSLMPSGSRAVVMHAGPDDYSTDPAGDSGGRIACGPIAVNVTGSTTGR